MKGIDQNFLNKTNVSEHKDLNNDDFSLLIQDQLPWVPFDNENINQEDSKRNPATSEQIRIMNERLSELGELFKDSKFNWHLDGALNISLMNGEYIGNHKDVDLSIERKDLKDFEEHLLKNGYGLFLSKEEDNSENKEMRRVGYKNFKETKIEHTLISAIDMDDHGKIRIDKNLNNVDVHIIERNANGEPLGVSGVVIPEKWTKANPIKFQEQIINLSHPGKVLYYKLHKGRDYDTTDIERLIETGVLNEEDIDEIKGVYEKEFIANKETAFNIFKNVSQKINLSMNMEQILEVLKEQPEFETRAYEKLFINFAQKIFHAKDFSTDTLLNIAVDVFGVEDKNNLKIKELNIIKQKVAEVKRVI